MALGFPEESQRLFPTWPSRLSSKRAHQSLSTLIDKAETTVTLGCTLSRIRLCDSPVFLWCHDAKCSCLMRSCVWGLQHADSTDVPQPILSSSAHRCSQAGKHQQWASELHTGPRPSTEALVRPAVSFQPVFQPGFPCSTQVRADSWA